MKLLNVLIITLLLSLLPLSVANAHKVVVFAWIDGNSIHVQGSFGSKRKIKKANVQVKDEQGREIYKGQINTNGECSFPKPDISDSDLIVFVDAGSGHKGSWTITKEELVQTEEVDIVDIKNTDKESSSDLKAAAAAKKMEELEKSPSLISVISGIGIIFFLAVVLKMIKKKKIK